MKAVTTTIKHADEKEINKQTIGRQENDTRYANRLSALKHYKVKSPEIQ